MAQLQLTKRGIEQHNQINDIGTRLKKEKEEKKRQLEFNYSSQKTVLKAINKSMKTNFHIFI
jgi:hypothetical protein